MKAAVLYAFGSSDVLTIADVPIPCPQPYEVLVKVEAMSINPIDWKIRSQGIKGMDVSRFPLILGLDIAGTVVDFGENTTLFRKGDRVFGYINMNQMGGYAEYVAVSQNELCQMPKGMDFIQAASLPVAGVTASLSLIEAANVQSGQLVLIHAAAGGVGSIAVQIAKALGATVIGTASRRNHQYIRKLGVDIAIDYTTTAFEEHIREVDVVLDGVGGSTQEKSYQVLKKGGMLISITTIPNSVLSSSYNVVAKHVWANPNIKHLNMLSFLYSRGKLKSTVSNILPLVDVAKAHLLSESGHVRGKIVLIP